MRRALVLAALLLVASAGAADEAATPVVASTPVVDLVRVVKSERRLYLLSGGQVIGRYRIALGPHPLGPKRQQGDGRTPEGRYVLDAKKADSDYYKAIHISYPNADDLARARARGVKPGEAIMIHGQRNGYASLGIFLQRTDWTNGCIALANADMDEVWNRVAVGTPIELLP